MQDNLGKVQRKGNENIYFSKVQQGSQVTFVNIINQFVFI